MIIPVCFRIGGVIDEDVLHARVPFVARTQQCFAVKAGTDGLLDIARRSFCDTSEGFFAWWRDELFHQVFHFQHSNQQCLQQYTTWQRSIGRILSYQIWKSHITAGKVFTLAYLRRTYRENFPASLSRLMKNILIFSKKLLGWFSLTFPFLWIIIRS